MFRNTVFGGWIFVGVSLQACWGTSPSEMRMEGLRYTREDYVSQAIRIKSFRLAASAGDQESMYYLNNCYDRGDIEKDGSLSPEQYPGDSFSWLKTAVLDASLKVRTDWENKEVRNKALYALARKYYQAAGTERNLDMTNFLMSNLYDLEKQNETISSLGYKAAYYRFKMSLNGEGAPQNRNLAESILEEMVSWNNADDGELSCIIGLCNQLLGRLDRAISAYEEALNREYTEANCFLGWCYEHGIGVQRNLQAAESRYSTGIRDDDEEVKALSCCLLAYFYERNNEGSDEEIFELYRDASEVRIFPEVDFYMGWIYEHGLYGVSKDLSAAQNWYESAMRKGYSGAYVSLASLLESQVPMIESEETILRLYRTSEERGSVRGLFHHSQVTKIPEEQIKYSRLCLEQLQRKMPADLFVPCMPWLDKNNELSSEEITAVNVFARSLTELDRGSLHTRFEEQFRKEREEGPSESVFLMYKQLASLNVPEALCRLGVWYREGIHVRKNIATALEYFEKAAEGQGKDCAEAQYQLGMLYEAGMGCATNREKAKKYFRLAADQGHSYAKGALERLQDSGCLIQ